MGKIVIAGATGYIGRYLCLYLKSEGFDVLALGRNHQVLDFFKQHNIETLTFDVLNTSAYNRLPSIDVQAVVNLSVALPEHEIPMSSFYEINVKGNYYLLEYARNNGVKKFIMTSTHKVYYDIFEPIITEDMLPSFKGPHSPYIISKIAAEQWLQYYSKDYNMDCIALRLSGVHGYGSLMGFLTKDGIYTRGGCERFMENAIKGEPIEVWGDTSIKRDHVYIKDVISAIKYAITSSDGTKGVFNVSSGIGHTLYEEAVVISEVFAGENGKSLILLNPDKDGVKRGYLYSIDKIKKAMGWTPQYTDLHIMYEDYKAEWLSGVYHNYHYIKPEFKPITF